MNTDKGTSGIRPGKPIPTLYAGITFRSRLEANTAYLLDALGLRWSYESSSFLLASGDHFAPDFLVEKAHLWVEPRGQSYEKGDRQLAEFANLIITSNEAVSPLGKPPSDFLTIGPDAVLFHEAAARGFSQVSAALLVTCAACQGRFFLGISGDYTCRLCGASEGDRHLAMPRWSLGLRRGTILIDNLPMPEWVEAHSRGRPTLSAPPTPIARPKKTT